jgi:hypothetical protein
MFLLLANLLLEGTLPAGERYDRLMPRLLAVLPGAASRR